MTSRGSTSSLKKGPHALADLRLANRKKLVQIGIPALFVIILLNAVPNPYNGGPDNARTRVQHLESDSERYLSWLRAHGVQSEVSAFFAVSDRIISHALSISAGHEDSKFSKMYVAGLSGLLRVVFLFFASIRFWIALFATVVFLSFRNWKPYAGRDLLGVTGTGKLFFSGIHADLTNLTKDGRPNLLVPGLACPRTKSITEAAQSPLGKILRKYDAFNRTTGALAGIILAYPEVPFFAAVADENEKISSFKDPSLITGALAVLEEALAVQSEFAQGKSGEIPPGPETVQDITAYRTILRSGLRRTLTEAMTASIAKVHATEVAALVLAYQAGKILSYIREGNRWSRRTSYTHLSGRAVLHSIPDFSKEYSFTSREMIRRALVYGMRFSVFGPIRLATALTPETRALRQWTELFMAAPAELRLAIDEAEFYARATEIWRRWEASFFEGAGAGTPEAVEGALATDTGLLFLPAAKIVSQFHKCASKSELEHLGRLVLSISQMQRIHELSKDLVSDAVSQEGPRGPLPQFQKVFPPMNRADLKLLAAAAEMPEQTAADWLVIRNVFNTFGWLARQVGASSVPDHSCVYAVFKGASIHSPNGLTGKKGMVPLRGSYVEERIGKFWKGRFAGAHTAMITDAADLYEKLLQGIDIYAVETETGIV